MTTERGKSPGEEPSPSADWKKLVEDRIWRKWGLKGIVALAGVFAFITIWLKWDEVAKVPGIAEMVKLANRERLPRADPQRFSIAVAHLDGDANFELEVILADALGRFVDTERGSGEPSLQILRFDRTIELKGGDLEIVASKGHEAARRLLLDSGADVLLWGRVLKESIKKWVLKPYFGLGSRVKRPGIPRIGDRFSPFTGRTSTRIFMLSQYVDTQGQSEVGFAFCHLLGFELLPRLKNLKKQRLYRPKKEDSDKYANLQPILTRPINWEIIEQQYDELIKFATALRLGTADAESILRRFTKNNVQHPTYRRCVNWARL